MKIESPTHPYDIALRKYVEAWIHFAVLLTLSLLMAAVLLVMPPLTLFGLTLPNQPYWAGVVSTLLVVTVLHSGWGTIRTTGDSLSCEYNKLYAGRWD